MGGDRDDAFAQCRGSLRDGTRDHRTAAAPTGARAEGRERRVALNRVDVVDVDAERVGGELHGRGFEAVAGRPAGDVHVDLARRLDTHRRALGGEVPHPGRCRLDVAARADTEVTAGGAGLGLLAAERVVVEQRERVFEGLAR